MKELIEVNGDLFEGEMVASRNQTKDEFVLETRAHGTGSRKNIIYVDFRSTFNNFFSNFSNTSVINIRNYFPVAKLINSVELVNKTIRENYTAKGETEIDKSKFEAALRAKANQQGSKANFYLDCKISDASNGIGFKNWDPFFSSDIKKFFFHNTGYKVFLFKDASGTTSAYWNLDFSRLNDTSQAPKLPLSQIQFDAKGFIAECRQANLNFDEGLIQRFIAALCAKPFVILTGLAGSGKTKLAQTFSLWIAESESQVCIVPVGADWTNREPLLGFPNSLCKNEYVKPDNKALDLILEASANPENPYFLILDEMNLSHVERYFADFLSVMESNSPISLHAGENSWDDVPPRITMPSNLFIIGTVNIDETTYMFSPKVLDRASVIEFRVTKEEIERFLYESNLFTLDGIKFSGSNMGNSFLDIAGDKTLKTQNAEDLNEALVLFFTELKKCGAEFGYRTAAEILRFAGVINKIAPSWTILQMIDAAIMQKLLPKVHGSKRKLEPILKTLGTLCLYEGYSFEEFLNSPTDNFADDKRIKYCISFEKIWRMYHNLTSNGFTSYAEA